MSFNYFGSLDKLKLPPDLDGSAGTNRASTAKIAANTDVAAISTWQDRYSNTPSTFESYKKESDRLLLWAANCAQKPVSSLTYEDFATYERFLLDPQPAEEWIRSEGKKVSRLHPDWRPFHGPLSAASTRFALRTLNSMMRWLVDAGYLQSNPLTLSRVARRKIRTRVTRLVEENLWMETLSFIETMPKVGPRNSAKYVRARWIFTLFYLTGLRISEVVKSRMGNFFERATAPDCTQWWLEIYGKGDKLRMVPATTELMQELARYRAMYGLSARPLDGEAMPLIGALNDVRTPITRAALHAFVKQVFAGAAHRVSLIDGDNLRASKLAQASAHWLRHTAGSAMADHQVDARHIRDTFGHASLTTTNLYLHVEDDERHHQVEEKHHIGWERFEQPEATTSTIVRQ